MWYLWLLGAVALAAGAGYAAYRFSELVIRPPRSSREEVLALEHDQGGVSEEELSALAPERGELTTFDGVRLSYLWFRCGKPTGKVCVLVHGFTSRWERMARYAKIYLARGYDALLFDHRNSGASQGDYTTMGHRERRDLQGMLALARRDKASFGKEAVVGAHGVSMGAATALLACCMENPPDFVVSDCAFADFREQLSYNVRHVRHLPTWPIAPMTGLAMRLRAGFSYRHVSPIREMEKHSGLANIPILFIHGTSDTFIPKEAAERLYQSKRGFKRLALFPGAGHARCIAADPARYESLVNAFLEECGF